MCGGKAGIDDRYGCQNEPSSYMGRWVGFGRSGGDMNMLCVTEKFTAFSACFTDSSLLSCLYNEHFN